MIVERVLHQIMGRLPLDHQPTTRPTDISGDFRSSEEYFAAMSERFGSETVQTIQYLLGYFKNTEFPLAIYAVGSSTKQPATGRRGKEGDIDLRILVNGKDLTTRYERTKEVGRQLEDFVAQKGEIVKGKILPAPMYADRSWVATNKPIEPLNGSAFKITSSDGSLARPLHVCISAINTEISMQEYLFNDKGAVVLFTRE